jgi:hypothetical protein
MQRSVHWQRVWCVCAWLRYNQALALQGMHEQTTIIVMYLTGGMVMLGFIMLLCHFTLAENFQTERDQSKEQLSSLLRCLVLYC